MGCRRVGFEELEEVEQEGWEKEDEDMHIASAIQIQVHRPHQKPIKKLIQYPIPQPHKVTAPLHFILPADLARMRNAIAA